jgi:tetratricopeptide (TPR) repeat protein
MKRRMVIVLVIIGLALGAGIQAFSENGADKVKAANLRAAQDYYQSGLMLAGEGREDEAVRAFRQALSIRPDWAEAHSLLGSILFRAGNYPEAEIELRKAVTLKPDYAEGWNFLGEFLQAKGKEKEAQEAFKKAKQFAR